jgi:hypothetical protein
VRWVIGRVNAGIYYARRGPHLRFDNTLFLHFLICPRGWGLEPKAKGLPLAEGYPFRDRKKKSSFNKHVKVSSVAQEYMLKT